MLRLWFLWGPQVLALVIAYFYMDNRYLFWFLVTLFILFMVVIHEISTGRSSSNNYFPEMREDSEMGRMLQSKYDSSSVRLDFPDHHMSFLVTGNEDGTVSSQRIDPDNGNAIGFMVNHTKKSYQFGETPAQSAAKFIARQVKEEKRRMIV